MKTTKYIILKTINNGDNEVISIKESLQETQDIILNITKITINGNSVPIFYTFNNPTDDSPDGYYIYKCENDNVKCDIKHNDKYNDKYNIIHKKTIINHGYIYTSATISLEQIGTFEIIKYEDKSLLINDSLIDNSYEPGNIILNGKNKNNLYKKCVMTQERINKQNLIDELKLKLNNLKELNKVSKPKYD